MTLYPLLLKRIRYALPGIFLGLISLLPIRGNAQFFTFPDTLNGPRLISAGAVTGAAYSATMIGLNELWYKDYPRTDFHFFNDNAAWMQMDKAGHALTAYQLSRYGWAAMRWSGVKERPATWIGSAFSLFFLSSVEVLDGFSEQWGFSGGDMAANVGGSALFLAQELAWGEQRIAMKFSYSPSEYAQYRPDLLGNGDMERIFKDYNGQTIWLSINPSSFSHRNRKVLPWLNIALGYGAEGMTGGVANPLSVADAGSIPAFDRYRQVYLSLDVDLTKIPTRSGLLKTVFGLVNFIKIPAPALEYNPNGLSWHWLYF